MPAQALHVGVFNLTENWRKKKSSNAVLHLQVFDLKGSLRNRNVKTDTGKESCDVVLLDENLLKMVRDNPLYIRSHCKAVLRASIHSDSQFLSSHLIIDYSLLVGRDDTNNELVVGIIGRLPFAFACFQLATLLSSGLGIFSTPRTAPPPQRCVSRKLNFSLMEYCTHLSWVFRVVAGSLFLAATFSTQGYLWCFQSFISWSGKCLLWTCKWPQ